MPCISVDRVLGACCLIFKPFRGLTLCLSLCSHQDESLCSMPPNQPAVFTPSAQLGLTLTFPQACCPPPLLHFPGLSQFAVTMSSFFKWSPDSPPGSGTQYIIIIFECVSWALLGGRCPPCVSFILPNVVATFLCTGATVLGSCFTPCLLPTTL